MDYYLGVHTGHDSCCALLDLEGKIIFAASEERFTRNKDQVGMPLLALNYIQKHYNHNCRKLFATRLSKWERVVRDGHFIFYSLTHGLTPPNGIYILKNYWLKLLKGRTLERNIGGPSPLLNHHKGRLYNISHHKAHAASAYYLSGFQDAWVMTLDGQGDDHYSTTFYKGNGSQLMLKRNFYFTEITVGSDYRKVTAMLGFHAGRHPLKVTGLAAYGEYKEGCIDKLSRFLKESWQKKPKGGYLTYDDYQLFSPMGKQELKNIRHTLLKEYKDEDIAYAIQFLTEKKVLSLIQNNIPNISESRIALAGGVFGNVKLNQRIKELGFKEIFIQPAMSDQGQAVGAILYYLGKEKRITPYKMPDVYLGPGYSNQEIKQELDHQNISYRYEEDIETKIAELLARGKVVARFNGRMEYGPRALGNRSILYQTTDIKVNDWLNKKLKRTEFMPFAPVTLAEQAGRCYKDIEGAEYTAKFMTITFDCTEWMRRTSPAVVHVDGTARPQILSREDNPSFYRILEEYYRLTGIPSLINTSFNMHEEPIVCTPYDAIRAYKLGGLDYLAIGNYLLGPI